MWTLLKKIITAFGPMVALYGLEASLNFTFEDICLRINNLDTLFHTMGGFLTAWTGFLLYRILKEYYPHSTIAPRWLFSATLVWFTAFVGVSWEWYEFFHDRFMNSHSQISMADTMKDLFLDILGAAIFTLVLSRRSRNAKLKPGEY